MHGCCVLDEGCDFCLNELEDVRTDLGFDKLGNGKPDLTTSGSLLHILGNSEKKSTVKLVPFMVTLWVLLAMPMLR